MPTLETAIAVFLIAILISGITATIIEAWRACHASHTED